MTDDEYKAQYTRDVRAFDDMIRDRVLNDGDTPEGSMIIGWAVAVAYRTPKQLEMGTNSVTQAWYVMEGQPPYASIGLLNLTADDLAERTHPPNDDD